MDEKSWVTLDSLGCMEEKIVGLWNKNLSLKEETSFKYDDDDDDDTFDFGCIEFEVIVSYVYLRMAETVFCISFFL